MNTMATIETVTPMSEDTLTAHDRCDRCGSAAYVRVSRETTALDFCGHHYRKHGLELVASGFAVTVDQRADLEPKPVVVED